MGAIRRYYDTVNTQISNITTSLAGYLQLSGGTVTGNLTVNGSLTGANGIGTIGPNAAFSFADRTGGSSWLWYSTGNVARLWAGSDRVTVYTAGNVAAGGNINGQTITGSQLTSTGNINVSGNINATNDIGCRDFYFRNCTATGTINGSALYCDGHTCIDVSAGNPLIYKAGGAFGIQLQPTATYYDNDSHLFRNSGTSNTLTIDPSGNVNATAQVQGLSLYSRSDINAAGSIGAGFDISAGRHMTVAGNFTCNGTGSVAGNFTCAGTGSFNKINMTGSGQTISISGYVIPYADHGMNVGLPGSNADSMHAYAFVVPSDEKMKTDIQDLADCLPLLKEIRPRTYRLPGAPDPDTRRWGFVAQQIGDVMRLNNREFAGHRIDTDPNTGEEHQGLDTHQMLALLWKATQELATQVQELKDARHV